MANGMTEVTEPILDKIVKGIEAKLPPELRNGYEKIVVAGGQVLFSDKTHQMMEQKLQAARQSGDIPGGIVSGTVDLIKLLYQQSQGKMDVVAAFPAATTLMCYIFDFAEKQEPGTQFSNEIVGSATHSLIQKLLETFQISQEDLAKGAEHNQQKSGGGAPAPEAPATAAPEAPVSAAPAPAEAGMV